MIPAAVIGSLGEGLLWSASPLYVIYLVKEYYSTRCDQSVVLDSVRNRWFGHFYGILKSCQVNPKRFSFSEGENFGVRLF